MCLIVAMPLCRRQTDHSPALIGGPFSGGHGPTHGPLGGLVHLLMKGHNPSLPRGHQLAGLHDQGVAMRGWHAGPGRDDAEQVQRIGGRDHDPGFLAGRVVASLAQLLHHVGRGILLAGHAGHEPPAAHFAAQLHATQRADQILPIRRRSFARQQIAKHHAPAQQQLPAPGVEIFFALGRVDQAGKQRPASDRRGHAVNAPSRVSLAARFVALGNAPHGGKCIGRNQAGRRQLAQGFFQVAGQQLRGGVQFAEEQCAARWPATRALARRHCATAAACRRRAVAAAMATPRAAPAKSAPRARATQRWGRRPRRGAGGSGGPTRLRPRETGYRARPDRIRKSARPAHAAPRRRPAARSLAVAGSPRARRRLRPTGRGQPGDDGARERRGIGRARPGEFAGAGRRASDDESAPAAAGRTIGRPGDVRWTERRPAGEVAAQHDALPFQRFERGSHVGCGQS